MDRRDSLKTAVWLLALCATAFGHLAVRAAEAKRPNILFFLIDDQRNDTLGCAGHPVLKTPNADRLAESGVRFQNAFVTTSICAASRASLFTGMTERTHGYTFGKPPVPKWLVDTSYPALLKKAGYRTGFVGKFGVNVTGKKTAIATMFHEHQVLRRGPYFKKQKDGSQRHVDELAGDWAVEFLKKQPKDKPFCLSVSFNSVHAEDSDKKDHYPWPKAVDGLYADTKIAPPRLGDPKIFASQPEFLRKSMNRDRFFWRWDTPEKYDKNMRAYFRMLTGMDGIVGRVVKAVEELGFGENTVIVYMGDNGYYMGDRGFAGKWSHYEQSLRVPLIICDPRAPKDARGKVLDPMALNIDLTATFVDLAGVKIPEHYQGKSLAPLLKGEAPDTWREDFFCEHLMENKSIPKWEGIRGSRYVYARYFSQKPVFEFLHDLKEDPDQLKNLAGDAAHAETLKKMSARCDELRDRYKAAKK